MEKGELLETWTNKLYRDLHEVRTESEKLASISKALVDVFGVGFEAGKDAQKLEAQLNRLGEPTPINP
jgi:hypothetical protein